MMGLCVNMGWGCMRVNKSNDLLAIQSHVCAMQLDQKAIEFVGVLVEVEREVVERKREKVLVIREDEMGHVNDPLHLFRHPCTHGRGRVHGLAQEAVLLATRVDRRRGGHVETVSSTL